MRGTSIRPSEPILPGDVEKIFLAGWKLKLKAVAVYRDGCKRSQPVSAG